MIIGRTEITSRALWIPAFVMFLTVPSPVIAQSPEAVAAGARVYGDMCGRCHNPRSPLERTDREWITIMNHMRVRANLTGEEIRDVLAFLQATNTDPSQVAPLPRGAAEPVEAEAQEPVGEPVIPSTDPRVIEQGSQLVQGRACLGCHVIGKSGGQVGPSLNGVVGRRGAEFVRRKLADPTFNAATSMMPNFGLTPAEIDAIVAFLATLDGN